MMVAGELSVDRVMAVSSFNCPSEDSDLAAMEGDRALAYSAIRDEPDGPGYERAAATIQNTPEAVIIPAFPSMDTAGAS